MSLVQSYSRPCSLDCNQELTKQYFSRAFLPDCAIGIPVIQPNFCIAQCGAFIRIGNPYLTTLKRKKNQENYSKSYDEKINLAKYDSRTRNDEIKELNSDETSDEYLKQEEESSESSDRTKREGLYKQYSEELVDFLRPCPRHRNFEDSRIVQHKKVCLPTLHHKCIYSKRCCRQIVQECLCDQNQCVSERAPKQIHDERFRKRQKENRALPSGSQNKDKRCSCEKSPGRIHHLQKCRCKCYETVNKRSHNKNNEKYYDNGNEHYSSPQVNSHRSKGKQLFRFPSTCGLTRDLLEYNCCCMLTDASDQFYLPGEQQGPSKKTRTLNTVQNGSVVGNEKRTKLIVKKKKLRHDNRLFI